MYAVTTGELSVLLNLKLLLLTETLSSSGERISVGNFNVKSCALLAIGVILFLILTSHLLERIAELLSSILVNRFDLLNDSSKDPVDSSKYVSITFLTLDSTAALVKVVMKGLNLKNTVV